MTDQDQAPEPTETVADEPVPEVVAEVAGDPAAAPADPVEAPATDEVDPTSAAFDPAVAPEGLNPLDPAGPDADEPYEDQGPDVLGEEAPYNLNALRGVQAGPAPHPRTI